MRTFVVAAGLLLLLGVCVRCGVVVGRSMVPTLRPGQWFVMECITHHWRSPQVGDVVAFMQGGELVVKRVVATAGQTARVTQLRPAGYRWVPRIVAGREQPVVVRVMRQRTTDEVVPEGRLFVVGDNAGDSEDSRHFGTIPVSRVRGRVLFCRPTARISASALPPVVLTDPTSAAVQEPPPPQPGAPRSAPFPYPPALWKGAPTRGRSPSPTLVSLRGTSPPSPQRGSPAQPAARSHGTR